MFAITIGTVLFPTLSRYAADNDMTSFRDTLSMGVRQIFFVSMPFVAWFVVVPHSIVQLIYQHGHFLPADTATVAPILAFFTLGMAFANVNVMFNRGFQSLQRPWLPLYVGIVNLVLNALLDWVLYKPLGARGIVLSTSIVSAFNFVALLVLMRRQIEWVDGRRILVSLGKALTCSAALWHGLRSFADSGLVPLTLVVVAVFGAGGLVYLGAAKALRVEELSVVNLLLRRGRNRVVPPAETEQVP
jgi:putative peptidoglycan lipid II flippase